MPRTATIITQNSDYTIDFANNEFTLHVSFQVWDGDPEVEPGGLSAAVVIEAGDTADDIRDKVVADLTTGNENEWTIPNNTPIYWTSPERTHT